MGPSRHQLIASPARPFTLLCATLIGAANVLAQSALDKPVEPVRPTIRTEIYRGKEAGGVCGVGTARLEECTFAVQNKNVQQNTASDAFNAGLYFNSWLIANIDSEAVKSATGGPDNDALAARLFRKMKDYQMKLRIDNTALCEATKVVCPNVLPMMNAWDAK